MNYCFGYYDNQRPHCQVLKKEEALRQEHMGTCNTYECPFFKPLGQERIMKRIDKQAVEKAKMILTTKTFERHGYLEPPVTKEVKVQRGIKRRRVYK